MATSEPKVADTEDQQSESPAVVNPEQYIKHPLQNRWALWYFKNDKSKSWTENLRLISKFDTVEDFWALYNHIQQPSKLGFGCDYSLFKDGIKPMWEDDRNKLGGRWLMTLTKQQRHNDLDRYWMETVSLQLHYRCLNATPLLDVSELCDSCGGLWCLLQLLCLVGESFDEASDDVCGSVVNVRPKGDKISIWTSNCQNREAIMTIGQLYKERLKLPMKAMIGYQSHDDTSSKSGSTTKNMYSV
ncbi:eukaryotic translation initiation factor 4E family member 1c isoform X1 [Thalassophryne amazonica]|uniref:eukaryotic translation initiation factor 4E family member 1c isoform X1 n=1 Tax=Thalassophryne amazonica TaxID=390379 RepID=UPI0014724CAF|nr:eukaryotic translation initiation factor 4E family member 1c isoform X1 [Thalassophryne amazonica]